MRQPSFLELEEVLEFHQEALERFGGALGTVQRGQLESALNAPLNRFHYEAEAWSEREGIAQLAATYWVHVALAHGFADGNKRVAFACFIDFIARNGYDIALNDDEAIEIGLAVASRQIDRDALAERIAPYLGSA